jgi:hypothetical protein
MTLEEKIDRILAILEREFPETISVSITEKPTQYCDHIVSRERNDEGRYFCVKCNFDMGKYA